MYYYETKLLFCSITKRSHMSKESTRKFLIITFKKMLSRAPLDTFTVDDILQETGLSRTTFYRLFKDKYDLMNACYQQEFSQILNQYPNKWNARHYQSTKYFSENIDFYRNAFKTTGPNSFKFYLYQFLIEMTEKIVCTELKLNCLSEKQKLCISYHSAGMTSLIKQFVLSNDRQTHSIHSDIFLNLMPKIIEEIKNIN